MTSKRFLRFAGALTALTLTTAAAGCSRSETSTSGTGGATTPGGGAATVKTGTGISGDTITLGVVSPLTGPAAPIGIPLTNGNQAYFKALNDAGGIAGKYKVQLEVADSKYDPPTAVQQYETMKGKVAMFAQLLGTPSVDAIKGKLKTDKILAAPASLDAFWVRDANLLPIGAPYQIQVINGIDYAVRKLDAKNKKLCSFVKDDPYGETAIKGLDYAKEKYGLTVTSAATYKDGDEFTAQVSQLKNAGCELVVFGSLANATLPIIAKASQADFAPTWLSISPTWNIAFGADPAGALTPYFEKNFLVISEGGNWGDMSIKGMPAMVAAKDKYYPDQKPDGYFGFGYNQGNAIRQVLEEAVKLGDLTPAGILEASHKIAKLTFDDLYGDYVYGAPEDRNPPRANTVFKVKAGVPVGLLADEKNFTSPAATEYKFE